MTAEPGLRERKKQQTRQQIAETARRLFGERGFDAVTVAEVAREADVSEGTVFNYFPTKEDLFYSGMEVFEVQLLDAVQARSPGESVLSAFRRYVLDGVDRLESDDVADVIASAARITSSSRALRVREQEIVAGYTDQLATLIADEANGRPSRVEAWAVANALMGAQRALVAYVHASVLDGKRGPQLAAAVRSEGKRAFARLERGLADYAVKSR
jgi:AcrR family transcriptional regulator